MFWYQIVSFKLRTRQYLGVRISRFTAIELIYRYKFLSFWRLSQIAECLRRKSGNEESGSEFSRLRLQKVLKILCVVTPAFQVLCKTVLFTPRNFCRKQSKLGTSNPCLPCKVPDRLARRFQAQKKFWFPISGPVTKELVLVLIILLMTNKRISSMCWRWVTFVSKLLVYSLVGSASRPILRRPTLVGSFSYKVWCSQRNTTACQSRGLRVAFTNALNCCLT